MLQRGPISRLIYLAAERGWEYASSCGGGLDGCGFGDGFGGSLREFDFAGVAAFDDSLGEAGCGRGVHAADAGTRSESQCGVQESAGVLPGGGVAQAD